MDMARIEPLLEGPASLDRQRADEANHGRSADADQCDEYELHGFTSLVILPVKYPFPLAVDLNQSMPRAIAQPSAKVRGSA